VWRAGGEEGGEADTKTVGAVALQRRERIPGLRFGEGGCPSCRRRCRYRWSSNNDGSFFKMKIQRVMQNLRETV
jgi:hypothetical protein